MNIFLKLIILVSCINFVNCTPVQCHSTYIEALQTSINTFENCTRKAVGTEHEIASICTCSSDYFAMQTKAANLIIACNKPNKIIPEATMESFLSIQAEYNELPIFNDTDIIQQCSEGNTSCLKSFDTLNTDLASFQARTTAILNLFNPPCGVNMASSFEEIESDLLIVSSLCSSAWSLAHQYRQDVINDTYIFDLIEAYDQEKEFLCNLNSTIDCGAIQYQLYLANLTQWETCSGFPSSLAIANLNWCSSVGCDFNDVQTDLSLFTSSSLSCIISNTYALDIWNSLSSQVSTIEDYNSFYCNTTYSYPENVVSAINLALTLEKCYIVKNVTCAHCLVKSNAASEAFQTASNSVQQADLSPNLFAFYQSQISTTVSYLEHYNTTCPA